MKLITTNTEKKVQTPAISAMMRGVVEEALDSGERHLEDDWENNEVKPCMKCNSTGYDLEGGHSCLGCEGTGKDMEIKYGVSSGVAYSKVVQYGTDGILEYCKMRREEELHNPTWKKDDSMGLITFALPSVARMELMALGYPIEDWEQSGDMKSYAKAVQSHFPMYLTTNLII